MNNLNGQYITTSAITGPVGYGPASDVLVLEDRGDELDVSYGCFDDRCTIHRSSIIQS